MGTNNYIAKLKARLDQAIVQREHWKQLAENRNSIVVTEVCPESRSVEEYIIDADSVRASWRLIRGYREKIDALRAENAKLRTALAEQGERQEAVAWIVPDFGFLFPTEDAAQRYLRNINDLRKPTALYTTPQPGPDVRGLVEALELWLADYDKVAANPDFEPFPHIAEFVDKSRAALATYQQDT